MKPRFKWVQACSGDEAKSLLMFYLWRGLGSKWRYDPLTNWSRIVRHVCGVNYVIASHAHPFRVVVYRAIP